MTSTVVNGADRVAAPGDAEPAAPATPASLDRPRHRDCSMATGVDAGRTDPAADVDQRRSCTPRVPGALLAQRTQPKGSERERSGR
jgi:hypothetical protein